jgi:hypothetical protein
MSLIQDFDFSVDLIQALLWRHNAAVNLTALLKAKQDWYTTNQEEFWEDWYNNVFNLDTANDFGCAVWAIILGLPVDVIDSSPSTLTVPFGYGNLNQNYLHANFSAVERNPIYLTVAQRIIILKMRYWQMTSRGNFIADNVFLAALFGSGNVYIVDGLNMTAVCHYRVSSIPAGMLTIIQEFDLIPRPSAVALTYATI